MKFFLVSMVLIFLSGSTASASCIPPIIAAATNLAHYPHQTEKDWILAIAAKPAEDNIRLAFGHWLEAKNDVRGTYVRLQITEFNLLTALASSAGREILLYDYHNVGSSRVQETYFGLTKATKNHSVLFHREDFFPGQRKPSGIPVKEIEPTAGFQLTEVRRMMKTIETETFDLWNASDFGTGANKIVGWGQLRQLERGIPVVYMSDNDLIDRAERLKKLGVCQLATNANGDYYWDRYLANDRVVGLLTHLSYLKVGGSSGINRSTLEKLVAWGRMPSLVKLDLTNSFQSWWRELVAADSIRMPGLQQVVTGSSLPNFSE